MALKTFLFVVTNCLCIYFCYSAPAPLPILSFADFVLDGRNDCGLANNNQNVNKLFKIVSCPTQVRIFPDNYFQQRDVLPCFGAYDALYNLCELPHENINFTIPESFKDPKIFCTEAKTVYEHIPCNYKNGEVEKWGNALLSTMTNETLCNNLCVLNNEINELCVAMVTFAQKQVLLKETSGLKVKPSTSVNIQLKDQTTVSKPASETKIPSNPPVKDKIDSSNPKNPSESLSPSSGEGSGAVTPAKKVNDNIKETEEANQNSKGESTLLHSDNKLAKLSPVVDTHNTEGNVPVTETPKQEIKPSNTDKIVSTSLVTGISNMPKGSPNIVDEGMNDENDKAVTDDDFHGENEEAVPAEAKEKGNPDEENEKPIEEEKITAPDTEHAAYHGGMSPSFNTLGDSFSESEDSYSFTYIVTTMAALCCVYLLFHYRNKLLALALEGRKGRGSRGRGRPSSANYSKLHSNLEEAIASNVTTPSATHVLY